VDYQVRPPAGDPAGALILFHGRGADEHDLFPLLDFLDPERKLLGVTPRGPLALPPGGAHWYAFMKVGYPEPETFWETIREVGVWLDEFLLEHQLSYDRTILGGFSQGAVMTYALSLGAGLARPAASIGLSGFIPSVFGFELDLEEVPPFAIGHGTVDPVISVEFSRQARQILEEHGASVLYREYPLPHAIDPGFLAEVRAWLARVALAA
jgi:phospholipase/carboxylesterase